MRYKANANDTGAYYYYALNSRNDVIGLYDRIGALYARYTYDVWGNPVSVTNANGVNIASNYKPITKVRKNPDALNVGIFYRYTASGGIYVLRFVLFFAEQLVELFHKCIDIFELTVNRGEADISYLVDVLELVHSQLAYSHGGDLSVERALQLSLDVVHHLLYLFDRHRTLLARAEDTGSELVAVKDLTALVALDYNYRNGLDDLMGRKALAALETLSAAADALALIGGTRINDLALFISTVGTLHI